MDKSCLFTDYTASANKPITKHQIAVLVLFSSAVYTTVITSND